MLDLVVVELYVSSVTKTKQKCGYNLAFKSPDVPSSRQGQPMVFSFPERQRQKTRIICPRNNAMPISS